jgi:anti-sigma factor RsiW
MGLRGRGRPLNRHIDSEELNALVAPSLDSQSAPPLSLDAMREAELHVQSCEECSRKVSEYRMTVGRLSNAVVSDPASPSADCPDDHFDWHEVAAGLWPQLKSKQLIMHAALCDHCGPLLRAATSVDDDPTQEEERFLAQLQAPSRPVVNATPQTVSYRPRPVPAWRQLLAWKILAPAVALILIVILATKPSSSPPTSSSTLLSGPQFAEFAVNTHRQHSQGQLALDLRSDSQQILNEWFKSKSQFPLALPASPAVPGEERPYHLEGARLVRIGGQTGAYIAYQVPAGPAGLMVTPDSVAVASGGLQVGFKKVSFHYRMIQGYRVVTWSVHGLTYALVSQEGNSNQQSCMVCHSAMRDRDLSHTPTPFSAANNAFDLAWQ